jgi:hypothetical protein
MPVHRFDGFHLALELDDSWERTLPPLTAEKLAREIADARVAEAITLAGGTFACFMAKHDRDDVAYPTLQLAVRHLFAPELFDLDAQVERGIEMLRSLREGFELLERLPEVCLDGHAGRGFLAAFRLENARGLALDVCSLSLLLPIGDLVYTVGISGPRGAALGPDGACALLQTISVDRNPTTH